MVIDSGSQRSFISQSLASKLKLPLISQISIQLSTFGTEPVLHEFDVVKTRVQIGSHRFVAKFLVYK